MPCSLAHVHMSCHALSCTLPGLVSRHAREGPQIAHRACRADRASRRKRAQGNGRHLCCSLKCAAQCSKCAPNAMACRMVAASSPTASAARRGAARRVVSVGAMRRVEERVLTLHQTPRRSLSSRWSPVVMLIGGVGWRCRCRAVLVLRRCDCCGGAPSSARRRRVLLLLLLLLPIALLPVWRSAH